MSELAYFLPVGIVGCASIVVVFLDLALPRKTRYLLPWVAFAGAMASLLSIFKTPAPASLWFITCDTKPTLLLGGAFCLDHFGLFIWMLACGTGAVCILASATPLPPLPPFFNAPPLRGEGRGGNEDDAALSSGEYYGLILLSLAGMMLLAVAHDFLTLFLSLELMSVATYILTGSNRGDLRSNEAALKYLLLGAFSTAFLLLGIAFYFGATGNFSLALSAANPQMPFLIIGLGLIMVGALFKIGAFPFHFWIPDVYQGAPTPITGLMAVGVKAAAFAILARLAFETFGLPAFRQIWMPLFEALSILTMVIGNLLAMRQNNVKRMLAYSAIAHTGYLLLAFLLNYQSGGIAIDAHLRSLFFYLVIYGLMTLGAFGVVCLMRSGEDLEAYRGLAKKNPGIALCMAVFMVSLAGLPPTTGFFAKFVIFCDAVEQGFILAAVLGILTSVASLYYYLRVVVAMYMAPAETIEPKTAAIHCCAYTWNLTLLIYLAGLGTLVSGLLPGLLMRIWPQ